MGLAGLLGGFGWGPRSLLKGILGMAFNKHGSGNGSYPCFQAIQKDQDPAMETDSPRRLPVTLWLEKLF